MKSSRFVSHSFVVFIVMCCWVVDSWASTIGYSFRSLVKKSELIVEGIAEVQKDLDRPDAGEGWRYNQKMTTVRIGKVYKGDASKGDTLMVLNHSTYICDTSRLDQGGRYLLMLKKSGSAFVDTNHGQGTWMVVTERNETRILRGFTRSTNAVALEEFEERLQWALSSPDPDAEEIVSTAEQAKEIAIRTVEKGGFDLSKFQLRKVRQLKIASDIVGVAYKGDPMWFLHWVSPEAQGKSPRPADTFVFCYVHVHTGKTSHGPRVEPLVW